MSNKPWYIGCACDSAFVQHTAVMLTSLAANGAVPEAAILIAGFDLEAADYDRLRASAGPFGADIRFVDVLPAMLGRVAQRKWEHHYSLPIFGRLLLYDLIEKPQARLITLDSDMVVNQSLRPLFELNMLGDYVAATHDLPRVDDSNYFNSGLMVVDVEKYRHYDVTRRCLDWLADQIDRPRWPDQDALNVIVGDRWMRLDKTWNRNFCGFDYDVEPLTPAFYEQAAVAHFTGQAKPWNDAGHVGRALYERYLSLFRSKRETYLSVKNHVDTNFLVTAFETLLGREPTNRDELSRFKGLTARQVIHDIVNSSEFATQTLLPIKLDIDFPASARRNPLNMRHKGFASERLIVHPDTARSVAHARDWRSLLTNIIDDRLFQVATSLAPLVALAEASQGQSTLSFVECRL